MTDFFYDDYANGLWDPAAATLDPVAVLSDTIVIAAIDGTLYTPDHAADVSLDDIPTAAILGTATLTSVAVTGKAINATGTITGVGPAVADCTALVIFKDTGTPATSPLMVYIDSYAGLPFTPDGTDIDVAFDAAGIAHF